MESDSAVNGDSIETIFHKKSLNILHNITMFIQKSSYMFQ